jgi:hypothetical protein
MAKVIMATRRTASGACVSAPETMPAPAISQPLSKRPKDMAAFCRKLNTEL